MGWFTRIGGCLVEQPSVISAGKRSARREPDTINVSDSRVQQQRATDPHAKSSVGKILFEMRGTIHGHPWRYAIQVRPDRYV
jgi:hypothetical protein